MSVEAFGVAHTIQLQPGFSMSSDSICCHTATTELAEVSLDYESPLLRDLRSEDLPSSRRWPAVRGTRWPFTGLVDYLRPVGPGVYVGCGWKSSSDPGNYRRFLHFLLVRDYS